MCVCVCVRVFMEPYLPSCSSPSYVLLTLLGHIGAIQFYNEMLFFSRRTKG